MILRVPVNKVVGAQDALKEKVITDFKKYYKQLTYGYYTDKYKDILNEICLIESFCDLDKKHIIYEYYINNDLY